MKGFEGQQKITMNTSALESKIAAFKLFSMISDSMGTALAPYSEEIYKLMSDHIQYNLSKQIRKFSFKTIVNILKAVKEPQNVTYF